MSYQKIDMDRIVRLKGIPTLDLESCDGITDNVLEELKGIHSLSLSEGQYYH